MHLIRLATPALPLQEYVRFYAHREVLAEAQGVSHLIPARAFPLLEFVFGDRFQVVSANGLQVQMSPRAVIVGLQTHCTSRMNFLGRVECFVIMFQPTGLHRLFNIPLEEITDRAYDVHAVLGRKVAELETQLGDAKDFSLRVSIANQFLIQHLIRARAGDQTSAATTQILAMHGNIRIDDLARTAGLSTRHLQRCFLRQVGVLPKLHARILRFEAALDSKARCPHKSWTDVANDFGYYDQMHMIHDFQRFTGDTPGNILRELEEVFRAQIEAVRRGRRSISTTDVELIL